MTELFEDNIIIVVTLVLLYIKSVPSVTESDIEWHHQAENKLLC